MTFVLRIVPEDVSSWHQTDLPAQFPHVRYRGVVSTVDATLYLIEEMECAVMGQRFRRGFTAAEKTELWDRWKRGESLKAIGRAFGKLRTFDLFRDVIAEWTVGIALWFRDKVATNSD